VEQDARATVEAEIVPPVFDVPFGTGRRCLDAPRLRGGADADDDSAIRNVPSVPVDDGPLLGCRGTGPCRRRRGRRGAARRRRRIGLCRGSCGCGWNWRRMLTVQRFFWFGGDDPRDRAEHPGNSSISFTCLVKTEIVLTAGARLEK
jgi:hypothetical protein